MALLKNEHIFKTAMVMLSVYFIFDGLQHMLENTQRARAFDYKMYNTESWLFNNGVLLFKFSTFLSRFSKLFVMVYGFASFVCGAMALFFEEGSKRRLFLQGLFILVAVDIFVLHFPLVEKSEQRSIEMKHCLLSVMIAFSLLMVGGFRNNK